MAHGLPMSLSWGASSVAQGQMLLSFPRHSTSLSASTCFPDASVTWAHTILPLKIIQNSKTPNLQNTKLTIQFRPLKLTVVRNEGIGWLTPINSVGVERRISISCPLPVLMSSIIEPRLR